jgi:hypothetical protein
MEPISLLAIVGPKDRPCRAPITICTPGKLRKDVQMAQAVDHAVSKIQKEKRWRKLSIMAMWGGITLSVLADGFQIFWVSNHFHISLSEIISLDDFAGGSLFTVPDHPSFLVAAGIRFHLLVAKLILGVFLSGLCNKYWKCQDLAVTLYQTLKNKEVAP